MNIRQDAWSKEHDLLLANTVLKHVREGSTQLKAFEEAADMVNRTAAACGFRWNAVVRQHYIEAMETAKKERKQLMRMKNKPVKQTAGQQAPSFHTEGQESSITMSDVIHYLTAIAPSSNADSVQEENNRLKQELEAVKKELLELKESYTSMQEDYESLMQIMERARKLVVFSEESPAPVKFKMERNGNLEKVAE
ncbi:RsfA family transcriptional regulator [Domibacillus indicus]|uniref:RsfA family transcriptional regulator n=1 Tax=Domibacillus indicus TaxID=1437523 RepID=UPI0006182418|nr:RsfA family transcriptional regulator [Domibacillus indicus]